MLIINSSATKQSLFSGTPLFHSIEKGLHLIFLSILPKSCNCSKTQIAQLKAIESLCPSFEQFIDNVQFVFHFLIKLIVTSILKLSFAVEADTLTIKLCFFLANVPVGKVSAQDCKLTVLLRITFAL